MKIGFDAKRAFGNHTGLGNYARWIIRNIAKWYPQHELYLFTPQLSNGFANEIATYPQVKIISPQGAGKLFKRYWRTYSIADLCTELQLDVYHGLSNELPVGIEQFRGKKIVTIHDLIFLRYPQYYNNIDRYIYRKKFEYAAGISDQIVAVSKQTANDLTKHFKTDASKIEVCYQSCEHIEISETDAKQILNKHHINTPFFLCVGTIEQRKKQLEVVKAYHQAQITHFKLYLAGRKTDYAHEVQQYIETHNLQQHVVLLEHVSQEVLSALYQQAFAVVYNSEFEGFGIPALEALFYQKPLLASNTSSIPEIGGDAALYNHPNDVAKLAENMRLLMQNEGLYNQILLKGRQQSIRFETQQLITQIINVYDS